MKYKLSVIGKRFHDGLIYNRTECDFMNFWKEIPTYNYENGIWIIISCYKAGEFATAVTSLRSSRLLYFSEKLVKPFC